MANQSKSPSELAESLKVLFISSRTSAESAEYQTFLELVSTIAKRIVVKYVQHPEDLEEIVQEVLMAVHEARLSFDTEKPLLPWLYSISRFKAFDFLRRSSRFPIFLEIKEELVSLVTPRGEDLVYLNQILSSLSEYEQKLVQMVRIEDLSVLEASEKLGMSEVAVKVGLHRTLQSIRKAFGE